MNTQKSYRLFLSLLCLTLILMLTAGTVNAGPTQQTRTDFTAIDAYVTEQLNNLGIPGMALGIVQDGQVAHVRGFGVADSSGREITPQTPFYIGSVTKSFTALAVMQLVETGKIDLDAPVQTYLPWFELADKEASAKITVRNLLNQISGMSTKDGNRFWADQQGIEEAVRGLTTVQLTHPVGTTYQYNNFNYIISGLIIEKVSGQSYADYVTQHIFEPLDMRHSYAALAPALADGLSDGHIYMFGRVFRDERVRSSAALPSGFLMVSAEDMTHFAIAQMNDGSYSDTSVLSPQGIAEMHAPAVPEVGGSYWGIGWDVGEFEGMPAIGRVGDTGHFRAMIALLPEKGLGVILFANASGFEQSKSQVVDRIALGVFSMLNDKPAEPVSVPFMMHFLYWSILMIPALQVLGIAFAWQKHEQMKTWGVVLIVILNLAVALSLLGYAQMEMPLRSLLVVNPELGIVAIAVATLGTGWSIIYAAMNLKARAAK